MLIVKPKKCTECQLCMQICTLHHFGDVSTKRSRIRVVEDWPQKPQIAVCLACPGHECVAACPHDALTWDQWLQLDRTSCDQCGLCAEACPVDGIAFDPVEGWPLACDTCSGAYMCTQWCPTRAVTRKKS